MSTVSFTGLLVISAIAVAAPILAASVKRVKPPSAVVEIAAGIIVGPSVLAWVKIDQPDQRGGPAWRGIPGVGQGHLAGSLRVGGAPANVPRGVARSGSQGGREAEAGQRAAVKAGHGADPGA